MFCKSCGAGLTGEEINCPICGKQVRELKEGEEVKTNTFDPLSIPTTSEINNQNKSNVNYFNLIVDFIKKHKKIFIICSSFIFVLIIGIILFNCLYDFTKLSWDEEKGDYNVNITTPTTLTLVARAFDKHDNVIENIRFEVSDGNLAVDGLTATWKLPNKDGNYTITAIAPSGKKIEKKISVYDLKESNILYGVNKDEITEETDNDADGITDLKEKELGTNPYSSDTDNDGIPDKVEIDNTKTDPLKADTDEDGILDGNEIDLGLDPLKKDSKGDGVNDSDRELTYTINNESLGVTITINGKGNIASTGVDTLNNNIFNNMDGLLDKVFNFYSNGTFTSAEIKIKYNIDEITKKGLNEDKLSLYYFNEETKKLDKVNTTVDKENKVLIVTLNHFSKYVIGDDTVTNDNYTNDILFVIDNSISMYSSKQMEEKGYDYYTGADGNDSEFKRISLTNSAIDKFTGNYRFSVAEFAGSYKNLQSFTTDRESVKKASNSIKDDWHVSTDGTEISVALNNAINDFSEDENGHFILLMTDGKDTSYSFSSSKDTIIKQAKENDVHICVIGLGKSLDDNILKEIATSTGCVYNSVSDASGLDEIYNIVGAKINYNLVDTNNDGLTDGTIIADSGFITKRDGFSFSNYRSTLSENGHCYGMAFFVSLYYQHKLPLKEDAKHTAKLGIIYPYDSQGYNLKNTYFSDQTKNLYDYKTDNEIMEVFQAVEKDPNYRDRIENRVWKLKDEYRKQYEELGFKIVEKEVSGYDDFDKYESVLLDENSSDFKLYDNEDYQLYNAIWYLFIHQNQMKTTSFSTKPDQAFEELQTNLSNNIPQPISIGDHEINALRLIQDNNDSNKFKIEVYDNNYPGETRYVTMTRNKYSKLALDFTAWTNDYHYDFTYDKDNDGTEDDISLDLSYIDIE